MCVTCIYSASTWIQYLHHFGSTTKEQQRHRFATKAWWRVSQKTKTPGHKSPQNQSIHQGWAVPKVVGKKEGRKNQESSAHYRSSLALVSCSNSTGLAAVSKEEEDTAPPPPLPRFSRPATILHVCNHENSIITLCVDIAQSLRFNRTTSISNNPTRRDQHFMNGGRDHRRCLLTVLPWG